MRLTIVAGARPNFVKIAPIISAIQTAHDNGHTINYRLVHTGQHYDQKMSGTFFDELSIPYPDVNLGSGGGTQAEQTAAIMIRFEKELIANPADLVLVVGDVTSTLACSIVAKKLNTKVAHVEAGIRSFDLSMPEEINRMVTDSISDYFFTTSQSAGENLRRIGIPEDRIFFVGNVMIDTLLKNLNRLKRPCFYDALGLREKEYLVLTIHRPSNVDEVNKFRDLISAILSNVSNFPVIFPMHPRTVKNFVESNVVASNLHIVEPMSYLEFNYTVMHCKAVITDSGGVTEETTVLGVPCLTLRSNTERPETCTIGTNELIGTDLASLKHALQRLFNKEWKKGGIPPLWDGHSAGRIVESLIEIFHG